MADRAPRTGSRRGRGRYLSAEITPPEPVPMLPIASRLALLMLATGVAMSLAGCARSQSVPATPRASTSAHVASTTVPVPGACETRRTGPSDAVGCYLTGTEPLGVVGATPLYWHLDTYPTVAAATAARQG